MAKNKYVKMLVLHKICCNFTFQHFFNKLFLYNLTKMFYTLLESK